MGNFKTTGAALAIAALLAAGCSKEDSSAQKQDEAEKPTNPNEVALVVNGKTLTKGELEKSVEQIIEAQKDKIPTNQLGYARQMFRNNLAQSFIFENVIVAEAVKAGVTVSEEEYKAREADFLKSVANQPDAPKSIEEAAEKSPLGKERAMREFKSGVLIEKYLKAMQATAPAEDFAAKAKEIVDNIVSNNAEAAGGDAKALEKIKSFKAELDKVAGAEEKKAKFAELAKANSDCPSKDKGGDLDFFAHGMMVKEFDEAAFKLPLGEVSEPVKTQFGYHLIMVTDKKEAVEAKDGKAGEPEKVRASHILVKTGRTQTVPKIEEVEASLKKNSEREFTMKFITNLIRKAKIEASDEFKNLLPPEEPAE